MLSTISIGLSEIGSIASLIGIVVAIWQILKTRKSAEAARISANQTKKSVQSLINIVQVTKHCEVIKTAQQAISDNEIRLALHLLHELKSAIIELHMTLSHLGKEQFVSDLQIHITSMGIDIANMQKSLREGSNKLKKEKITSNLENLLSTLTQIQVKLKHEQWIQHIAE